MSDNLVNVMNVLLLIENGLDEKLAQRVSAQWKAKCEELSTLRARVREVVGPLIALTEDFKVYGPAVVAARKLMEEVK